MSSKKKHAPFFRRFFPTLLWRFSQIGIRIIPFITEREGACIDVDSPAGSFELGFQTSDNIEEILLVDPEISREKVERWFSEGKLCFGARDDGRLVGEMWCDLKEFNFPPNLRELEEDEAYLYAARVANDYRGKNLAPLMRSACYAALREMGRLRFYSYTDYFNYPARRFKEKLGVRSEALRLHLDLFGKWSATWTLKRYTGKEPEV